eukprot:424152-Prorocentrum_minimum.AAC.1
MLRAALRHTGGTLCRDQHARGEGPKGAPQGCRREGFIEGHRGLSRPFIKGSSRPPSACSRPAVRLILISRVYFNFVLHALDADAFYIQLHPMRQQRRGCTPRPRDFLSLGLNTDMWCPERWGVTIEFASGGVAK